MGGDRVSRHERSLFRNNGSGGRSSVVRLAAGSRFARHAHQGTEEVLVLQGAVRIAGQELGVGDYLYTGPGEEHDVFALSDAVIFVSSQKAAPLLGRMRVQRRAAGFAGGGGGRSSLK